jgi:hypothetical protein
MLISIFVLFFFTSVRHCQSKWRNLRDVFIREHNQIGQSKSGSAATKKKVWKWYSSMKFLIEQVSHEETTSNFNEGPSIVQV